MFSVSISNEGPIVKVASVPTLETAVQFALNLHNGSNVKHTVFVFSDEVEPIITFVKENERKNN